MGGHSAVEFLTAALARAEETVKAATAGPWTADVGDETVRSDAGTVATMRDWARLMTNAQVEADMALIVGHADPAAVLRRVAADREILADHQPTSCEEFTCDCHQCCAVCRWTEHDEAGREPVWGDVTRHVYPCRTVLLLAQAWGWTEEHRG